MSHKKTFLPSQEYGLSPMEIKLGKRWLRIHHVKGQIPTQTAYPLYEMFLIGYSLDEIQKQYPQWPYEQLCCTAALQEWGKQRSEMKNSLLSTVRAKVTKTMTIQVDFLTGLLNCYAKQSDKQIRDYLSGISKEPPENGIKNIKEYTDAIKALQTLIQKQETVLDGKTGRYDKGKTDAQIEKEAVTKSAADISSIISGERIID